MGGYLRRNGRKARAQRLVVFGAGYVGLVSGACLAELGHRVICVDLDETKLVALRAGRSPIYEPGLDLLLTRNIAAGRLSFERRLEDLTGVDAVFIAVGTPPSSPGGGADLTAVFEVARTLAPILTAQTVVMVKSTVPAGTGATVEAILRAARPDLTPRVVSNPEFLREGSAVSDFMCPDRIVAGCEGISERAVVEEIYRPLTARGAPLVFTGRRASELIKYASNAFLATKISFINEIADLCEAIGVDVVEVSRGVGMDRRIGEAFLQSGPGYGGSCFPKDSNALLATAREARVTLRVVASAVSANTIRRHHLAQRVLNALGVGTTARGPDCKVALLGVTFKANTNDVRDSPAVAIAQILMGAGVNVSAYDPYGMPGAWAHLPDATFADSAYACASGADCVIVATEWAEFRTMDLERLAGVMRGRVFVDLRNLFDLDALADAGFLPQGVGRVRPPPRLAPAAANAPTPSPMPIPIPAPERWGSVLQFVRQRPA